MRDTSVYVILLLAPPVMALLAAGFVRLRRYAKKRGASARTLRWIDALTQAALTTVRLLERTVVADLKDPTKPGTWDEVAKRSVKDVAMMRVRSATAREREEMLQHGVEPERIERATDVGIEATLESLKHAQPYLAEMAVEGREEEGLRVVARASASRVRRVLN